VHKGGTVGRLAESRLVLDQPVEEIGRHDTGTTMDVRVKSEPYMLDGRNLCHKVSMLGFALTFIVQYATEVYMHF